jgi:hypothetical protein
MKKGRVRGTILMENYFFMRTVLNWLAEPRRFNRMLAITLRVLATLIVPFSLVTFFKAGKVIFDLPASGILGGIVFQVFFVLAIYAVVHGLFIRARNIDALPGGEYNMFPLATILIRAAGEAIAAFISLVAVGGGYTSGSPVRVSAPFSIHHRISCRCSATRPSWAGLSSW